ncbi:MAG: hypothetical protein AAB514_00970, partial [Patescibacteria group bacterium]
VRRICPNCRVGIKITHTEFESLFSSLTLNILKANREFYRGKGCEQCNQSGYYGRLGIYEVLEIDDNIREAIMQRKNSSIIKNIATKNGMTVMLEDGFRKAIEGKTTIEEILRVIHE